MGNFGRLACDGDVDLAISNSSAIVGQSWWKLKKLPSSFVTWEYTNCILCLIIEVHHIAGINLECNRGTMFTCTITRRHSRYRFWSELLDMVGWSNMHLIINTDGQYKTLIDSGAIKSSNKWRNMENNSLVGIKIIWYRPYPQLTAEALPVELLALIAYIVLTCLSSPVLQPT